MIASRLTALLIVVTCAGAAILGWATAPSANAVTQYITMNIHPGSQATTNKLTCGWHGTCGSPPSSGEALDWRNSGGDSIYLRTRTSYDGSPTVGGYGQAFNYTGSDCVVVRVSVLRPSEDFLGYVYFYHTEHHDPWCFTISAGASPIMLASYVAKTAYDEEEEECPFSAAHLHQFAASPFAENWSEFPTAPATVESVQITNAAKYQDYVAFQY